MVKGRVGERESGQAMLRVVIQGGGGRNWWTKLELT